MAVGFYPGCSLEGSAREYNESVLALARALDLSLPEVPDWNCCGATAAHNLNQDLSLALPARILALASKAGFDELVVPCAACYSRLAVTRHELDGEPDTGRRIGELIEMDVSKPPAVLNVIQWLDRYVAGKLEGRVVHPIAGKVACYYGCLLVRPDKILRFDRPEDPVSMDALAAKAGATPIDWAFKTECCGAGFSISRTKSVARLSGAIVRDAVGRGAEMIVVGCPMCHSNLDMRRPDINRFLGRETDLPVVYITQLIGLAIGLDARQLGLHRHFVPVGIT